MKLINGFRLGVSTILLCTLLTACGLSSSPQIKGVLKDDGCLEEGVSLKGSVFSLAPFRGEENFGLQQVGNQWRGSTAITETDAFGNFAFNDIPEDKYVLLLFQTVLRDAQSDPILIEVKKDSHIDLGVKLVKGAEGGNCKIILTAP